MKTAEQQQLHGAVVDHDRRARDRHHLKGHSTRRDDENERASLALTPIQ